MWPVPWDERRPLESAYTKGWPMQELDATVPLRASGIGPLAGVVLGSPEGPAQRGLATRRGELALPDAVGDDGFDAEADDDEVVNEGADEEAFDDSAD